ncbi:MAG: hypothetical protein A2021_09570 [Elusimicrobia bacterium GWF2_52_66]|nr:MAG: hypothetical protein A2X33_04445 [Elusimicrobia bacterium GWA2_51_34]OGR87195.1 MAG: hypothetical protein A2021_09570 [Elusimicrobia bacterium GWF2_52_66]HCE97518.1 hypothetical protein [Elusimicrobiota bacterium]
MKKINNKTVQSSPGVPNIRTKRAVICVLTVILLLAAARSEFIVTVGKSAFPPIWSYYQLEQENFNHPRLQLLRKREKLDEITSEGQTEFEKLLLLRRWTNKTLIRSSGQFYYPPWDAVEIIDLARKYGNQSFCAQYAIVFLQACLSMGLHARYVDLPGHFIVSVWSDDFNKWIAMDPYFEVHYERNGRPLGGIDLCRAYWADIWQDIYKVDSHGNKTKIKKDDLYLYRMFSIVLKNTQLSEPVSVEVNGVKKKLAIESDYRNYPKAGRDKIVFDVVFLAWQEPHAKEYFPGKQASGDEGDFKDPFNQIMYIYETISARGLIKIKLEPQNCPSFKSFLINQDDAGYNEVAASILFWELNQGFNKLSVKVKTQYGWQGPERYIKVFYKRNWLKI